MNIDTDFASENLSSGHHCLPLPIGRIGWQHGNFSIPVELIILEKGMNSFSHVQGM